MSILWATRSESWSHGSRLPRWSSSHLAVMMRIMICLSDFHCRYFVGSLSAASLGSVRTRFFCTLVLAVRRFAVKHLSVGYQPGLILYAAREGLTEQRFSDIEERFQCRGVSRVASDVHARACLHCVAYIHSFPSIFCRLASLFVCFLRLFVCFLRCVPERVLTLS